MKTYDVLVLDSRYKHSLSAIRSLGGAGLRVAAASSRFSPSKFSRFCTGHFNLKKDNLEFDLLNILKENKVEVVMPIDYHSNIICSKIKDKIKKNSKILISSAEKMDVASNKIKMLRKISGAKINFPRTYIVNRIEDIKKIKLAKGIVKSSVEEVGKKVEYFNSKEELGEILKKRLSLGSQLVQEYVGGVGRGYFALCNNGRVLASFQHQRIRQNPETGGVSSVAESIRDEKLENYGELIVKIIGWSGACMVEFIYDPEKKKYYFIEFNPKFWGSLDLSFESGINFPLLLYGAAANKKVRRTNYKKNVRFQWVFPEDVLRIKTSKNKLRAFKEFLHDLINPKIKKDLGYLFKDPLPTLIRGGATIYRLFEK